MGKHKSRGVVVLGYWDAKPLYRVTESRADEMVRSRKVRWVSRSPSAIRIMDKVVIHHGIGRGRWLIDFEEFIELRASHKIAYVGRWILIDLYKTRSEVVAGPNLGDCVRQGPARNGGFDGRAILYFPSPPKTGGRDR